jgi:hypothetical protein
VLIIIGVETANIRQHCGHGARACVALSTMTASVQIWLQHP